MSNNVIVISVVVSVAVVLAVRGFRVVELNVYCRYFYVDVNLRRRCRCGSLLSVSVSALRAPCVYVRGRCWRDTRGREGAAAVDSEKRGRC